ncbi:MAG: HlyD family secretion protein, partial [Balneolaceae bacterium]|nr:HlyD family secretion protein [Balneolaceae bacterium]
MGAVPEQFQFKRGTTGASRHYLTTVEIFPLFTINFEQYYSIKARENKLQDFDIRAPFDGFVAESNIDVGSFVTPQMVLGKFGSNDHFEIETAIPAKDLAYISPGDPVQLANDELGITASGTVERIGNQISPKTQS